MTTRRLLSTLLTCALVCGMPGPQAWAAVGAAARAAARVVHAPAAPTALGSLGGVALAAPSLRPNLGLTSSLTGATLNAAAAPSASVSPAAAAPSARAAASSTDHFAAHEAAQIEAAASAPTSVPRFVRDDAAEPSGPDASEIGAGEGAAMPSYRLFSGGVKALQARFRELRAAFSNKKDDGVLPSARGAGKTSGLKSPDQPLGYHTPENEFAGIDAEPPSPRKQAPKSKASLSLGKAAMTFIAFYVALQAGVYAFRTAMPIVIQQVSGSFQAIAHMSLLFAAATIAGRQTAPWAVRKFGLRGAFIYANVARALLIGALAWGVAAGWATGPVILALHTAYGYFYGASITSSEAIATALVGRDQGRLERYWTVLSTLNQVAGIVMPIAAGGVAAMFGFLPLILALPAAIVIALLGIAPVLLGLNAEDTAAAVREQKVKQTPRKRMNLMQRMLYGAKLVMARPALRNTFWAYALLMLWTPLFFFLISPAYGLVVAGGHAGMAAAVSGWLTGLFGAGGLLGGLYIMWQQRRAKKNGKTSSADMKRSLLNWLLWGVVGLGGLAALAIPAPMFMDMFSLPGWLHWAGPLTWPALAILPFGATQTIVALKLRSYFQSQVPSQRDMADATSFYGSAGLAVGMAILWLVSLGFEAFTGFTPFAIIAALLVPIGALTVWVRALLAKSE